MLLIVFLAIAGVFCHEMAVTREYTDYLKRHVDWEVVDYEENIFRGWTIDEVKALLIQDFPQYDEEIPLAEADHALPSQLVWGANCIHQVRNQGSCGSCWAFAIADMVADRCCMLTGKDQGLLSPQELVSCDTSGQGCQGGIPSKALDYVIKKGGLVQETCFPYKAQKVACTNKCSDGRTFDNARVCKCTARKTCTTVNVMKTCLKDGPISVGFEVSRSLMNYKSGIYECDGSFIGRHAVVAVGYSESPKCHWIIRNSWGTTWGMQGYLHMACQTCKVHEYAEANVVCTSF